MEIEEPKTRFTSDERLHAAVGLRSLLRVHTSLDSRSSVSDAARLDLIIKQIKRLFES
jgi:hypothetical protein